MKGLFSRSNDLLSRLRLRGSAAHDAAARMLYSLMWGLLPIFAIHGAVGMLLTSGPRSGLVAFVNALLVSTPITSLILLRTGSIRSAGAVYLAGVWLAYTLIMFLNGGIHHVGLAVYIALPVSAAWLFGYKTALWVAAGCLGSATLMGALETVGVGPLHYFQGRPVGIWFILLECTAMGVVPVSIVLTSLRRALTQSQLAEAELKRTQEENLSRQKLESVGLLAAGIAHDFNNLLGGILAQAQLAEDELPPQSPALDGVRNIEALASRASEIVRQLMVYGGSETTHFAPVDLSQLIEEMLELLKVSISKHATLQTRLATGLPKVRGQASQLRQVVMNLIINASEALGEQDGVITISTSLVIVDKSLLPSGVTSFASGDYVRLEVADNGSGMEEDQKARVFDPFFTTKTAGRGLGLSVVHGAVRAHGGAIRLESAPSKGTAFHIFLPCAGEFTEEASGEPTRSTQPVCETARTVLLIEDEEMLRSAVAKILRKEGFSVIEAADGSVAMDRLRDPKCEIDTILLDLTIPGSDSLAVAEESSRIRPKARIVITSAYGREAGSQFFKIPQIAGFLRKPFRGEELLGSLAAASLASSANTPSLKNQSAGS